MVTAVDKGIRSYSQIVSQTIEKSAPVLIEEKLEKVVQEAVTDDDRLKNVMVFGLSEENIDDLDCKITALSSVGGNRRETSVRGSSSWD